MTRRRLAFRSMRRLRPVLAAAACVVVGVVTTGAEAFVAEPTTFHARPGERIEARWETPLAASDPGLFVDPDTCTAEIPTCVTIPLEIVPAIPRAAEADWLVVTTVDWPHEHVDTGLAGGGDSADLDLFVYARGTDADGNAVWEEVARSATQGGPETVKLFRPLRREYALVVTNFSGVADEFTWAVEFTDVAFSPPDTPGSGGHTVGRPPTTAPLGAPAPVAAPDRRPRLALGTEPRAPRPAPSSPADVDTTPDLSFGLPIAAPEQTLAGAPLLGRTAQTSPPRPVGVGTVLAASLPVPLAATAGALALFRRRRPAALRLAEAAASASQPLDDRGGEERLP